MSENERSDLLEALTKHRELFRFTVQGLTDEQAAMTPTKSELCLGGLIKHVGFVESGWVDFIVEGTKAMEATGGSYDAHFNSFRMLEGETLTGILADYQKVTDRTDEVLATVDLDLSHPLPEAPWFEPGASWSARRVFVHIVAETSQHAGHADILRETIDGQKSMG
ncbi:MAG: DinB family protein [Acidimicrobiales bacterium]